MLKKVIWCVSILIVCVVTTISPDVYFVSYGPGITLTFKEQVDNEAGERILLEARARAAAEVLRADAEAQRFMIINRDFINYNKN